MGRNSGVTSEYQEFLNLVKASRSARKDKNFFSYDNVKKLRDALNFEMATTKAKLQKIKDAKVESGDDWVDSAVNAKNKLFSWAKKKFKKIERDVNEDLTIDPSKVDLEDIRALRKELKKGKEYTPFWTFVGKIKPKINEYLAYVDNGNVLAPRVPAEAFQEECKKLYDALLGALKEYRRNAKSHYYFKSSIGRAEIANKMTGASLERWLSNSFKALQKVGTGFLVNENYKYICRKSTAEEDAEEPENKGRPKFLRNSKIIMDIVPKER